MDDSIRLMTSALDSFICSMVNTIVARIDPIFADDSGELDNDDGSGATGWRWLLLLQ